MSKPQSRHKPQERRRIKRTGVAQPPDGSLRLCVLDRYIDISQIQDVSPFGARLLINTLITDDAHVRLTCTHKDKRVEVEGTVVWRRVVKGRAHDSLTRYCWVGIFFYPRYMDANVEFFRALAGPGNKD